MRFEGTIKSWDETKGFGFLAPRQGGQDIFIHVSALPRGSGTPRVGQAFTFEVELNREGKKRAIRVAYAGQGAPRETRQGSRAREGEGRSPVAAIIGVVLAIAIGVAIYGKATGAFARFATWGASDLPAGHVQADEAVAPPATSFKCDGRTYCSQMTSCGEAKYFLKNCPGVKMDGNGDGIPCEQQWCTSAFSR